MLVLCSIFSNNMGLHYFYLHGKKLTPVQIMNSASMNNMNIVNSLGIFNGMNCASCEYYRDEHGSYT